jgi:hypothetical protein
VDKEERGRDEQPEGEAAVLPEREAMSLISPTPEADSLIDLDTQRDAEAAASGSEEESTTSEN